MKRWTAGLSMVLVLFAAGCGAPGGTDGDLVNGWSMLGKPGVPVPKVGECWTGTANAFKPAPGSDMKAVECGADHASKTFYVGQFTGTMAQKATVPASEDLGKAYTACNGNAKTFLG